VHFIIAKNPQDLLELHQVRAYTSGGLNAAFLAANRIPTPRTLISTGF